MDRRSPDGSPSDDLPLQVVVLDDSTFVSCQGKQVHVETVRPEVASSVPSITQTQARTMFVMGLGIARV